MRHWPARIKCTVIRIFSNMMTLCYYSLIINLNEEKKHTLNCACWYIESFPEYMGFFKSSGKNKQASLHVNLKQESSLF